MKNFARNIIVALLTLMSPMFAVNAADTGTQVVASITLDETLKATKANSPMLKKVAAENAINATDEEKVRAMKILPTINFGLRTGIVPEARGDVLFSQDKQTDLDGFGPFLQTEIKLVQPIYTFGRISNGAKAASKYNEAKAIRASGDVEAIEALAFQAYHSVVAARDALDISKELKDAYKILLTKIDEEVKKEKSGFDEGYLYESRSYAYKIENYYNTYSGQLAQAYIAFKEVTGISVDDSTNFDDPGVPVCELTESDMQRCIELAKQANMDFQAIEAGKEAIDAKIQYEKSNKYPLIYFGGGLGYGVAPNRDDQKNPFVYDAFNYLNLAAFIGVNWDLNFSQNNIEMKKWKYQKTALEESEKLLSSKLTVEMVGIFNEMVNDYKTSLLLETSMEAAQSWVTLDYSNWEMDVGDPERLVKALMNYFEIRGKLIENKYKYILSVINFAKSTGNLNNYLGWMKNGKVQIN